MALYVNTNVSALNGQRQLAKATNSLNSTYEHLSSGLRINSAKDDAAGLQISDRLTAQINGLNQGNRNCNDAIAIAQTIEGALDETTNMLQRIRTLSVQAANGTNTSTERLAIQREIDHLCAEITRIACETTFGGQTMLNGTNGNTGTGTNPDFQVGNTARGSILASGTKEGEMRFQVGANYHDTISMSLTDGFTMATLIKVSLCGDQAGTVYATRLSSASALGIRNQGSGMLANMNAGTGPTMGGTATLAVSSAYSGIATDDVGAYMSLSVTNQANAESVLAAIDAMINYVDKKRGDIGAVENRLEATIRNQANVAQNESDARSRIRDTDYAEESSNLASQTIIQQAASSMLTQANQRPQIALSLLGQ
ncbi:MAG: flagellin [Succinivibrio sp.]|nr:flagellin [Succinivibrio sp.]